MNLDDAHRGIQKFKRRKRIGRGTGSGVGKTSGRGHNGQRSRAGASLHPAFEGGQMPIARRVPKRGFNNRFAPKVAEVNLDQISEWFADGDEVSPQTLAEAGKVKGRYDLLKVLGRGELTVKKLKITAHRFSKAALEKIQQAGGEAVVLPPKAAVVKNKQKQKVKKPT